MEQYVGVKKGYKRNFYQHFGKSKNCLLDFNFQVKLVCVVKLYYSGVATIPPTVNTRGRGGPWAGTPQI